MLTAQLPSSPSPPLFVVLANGRRPDLELLRLHPCGRNHSRILVPADDDVVEILLSRKQGAIADADGIVGLFVEKPCGETLDDPVRHAVTLIRVDKSKHDDEAKEHAPVHAESIDQPLPVETLAELINEMHHIGAVEALSLLHERLGPDHLFGRTKLDGNTQHFAVARMREPVGIDPCDRVARAEDYVDEPGAAINFPEPVRISELGAIATLLKEAQGAVNVGRIDEHVQVL